MTDDYYEIVKDILENNEFKKRKEYAHHGSISVYEHSLKVSILAYKLSKKNKNLDSRSIAIGALLHDFYYEPWQVKKTKTKFMKKHAFIHATQALENSKKNFPNYIDDKVEDIIKKHMFPLNITPPKYIESWIVTMIDKYVSMEVFTKPEFFLYLFNLKNNEPSYADRDLKKDLVLIKNIVNKE